MKSLILLAAAATLSAGAVTIEADRNDPAIMFSANELMRILGSRAGRITLRADTALPAQAWHFTSGADGALVIAGRDGMGISYGTSTFLEKYAGVRWYAPDTEVIPDLADWKLPANLDETAKPAFDYREMYVGYDFMDSLWRLRNKETYRANFGCGVINGSPSDCHTFGAYAKALKAAHPELFGNRPSAGGQVCNDLCMTDEKTRDFVADEMCRHIEADAARQAGKPAYTVPSVYDLSQNDGGSGGECMCPNCKKLFEESGRNYSGPNIAFVSAVAERVKKRHPEVTIQTFAYSYTQNPPTNGIVAADNVNVRYCCSWVFDPLVKGTPQGDKLECWAKHARQFGIWSYWRTYRGILFPFVKKRAEIRDELRFCHGLGATRYYCEDENPLGRSFAMMQHWLFLKMSEDPSRDVFALSREFIRGYYGAAARPMEEYLDYLEKRQKSGVGCRDNPQRQHLDREFFEKVNAWLDEAERLAAGDARTLNHIHWERVVVDRSMYDGLGGLKKEGFAFDNAAVAKRFAANAREQIETWNQLRWTSRKDLKAKRLKEIGEEADLYAHYPIPAPEEFEGLDVETLEWNKIVPGRAEIVKDPAAAAGTAFCDPTFKYGLPFSLGVYNPVLREGASLNFTSRDDVPQDGKFHLYKLGRMTIMSPMYFHYSDWNFRRYMGTLGIVPEKREVWLSMKFQGPAYVAGSTAKNAVLVDRAFYVKNDDPMRGYEKAGESIVPKGQTSISVTSPDGSFKEAHVWLGDPAKMDCGLLVRGTCSWKNVKAADGKKVHAPFVGLWACTQKGGRNSFTHPCQLEVFPGDYENQPFETVIEADRLRRCVRQAGEPVYLTFRINLVTQPATVTVRDLEVIPVREQAKGPVGAARYDRAMAQEAVAKDDGLDWIDGTKIPIEGRAFDDTEHYYDRLPSNVTAAVNAGVRNMKHHTSGLQFRFATDSRRLRFRWTVYDPKQLEMQHMPRTGVSGIDVYRQAADGRWLFVRSGCPAMYTAANGDSFEFETSWTPGTPCLVNLPLYNGIRKFSLGVEKGQTVKPLPPRKSGVTKPVVFYGTSITHGGCCSRPGMAFPSIVGRRLDVPIVNLGFSGSGRMEYEMSEHLAKIDASCYVLDCLWNMGGKRWVEEKHRERYEPFVRNLRAKRPGVPIVMAEHCDVFCKGMDCRDRDMKALYDKLIAEGWDNLVYLSNRDMYPGDLEGTVDGAHASDYGMLTLAKAFGGAVAEALKLKK